MEYKRLGKTETKVAAIGQGTMGVGGYFTRDVSKDALRVDMLRLGIEGGMTLIDTAEVYGAGHSEELVGRAVRNCRKEVFIATKVSPEHLGCDNVLKSCEGSLRRLHTSCIDLYQIHWPNPVVSIIETIQAMEKLVRDGKVRFIGVSNFSFRQLKQAISVFRDKIASIQIEYNLFDRSAEADIIPYCQKEGISVLAYSPLDQGKFPHSGVRMSAIQGIARKYNKTVAQVALRWLVEHPQVIVIPKASDAGHIRENASVMDFNLAQDDFDIISQTFTQPTISIPTGRIRVSRDGLESFVPSPDELAQDIKRGDTIKPIRVIKTRDASGEYDYDLVEGKLRYWAWFIAHNGGVPIPALVREEWIK